MFSLFWWLISVLFICSPYILLSFVLLLLLVIIKKYIYNKAMVASKWAPHSLRIRENVQHN